MNLFWALLVLLVIIIVLFIIVPNIFEKDPAKSVVYKPVAVKPSQHQLEAEASKRMLESHYEEAKDVIPEDFPRKVVGDCPYSKPMSTDLPLTDMPMSLLTKGECQK
jgi:hypothetical protein